jgi:hypothetical protein
MQTANKHTITDLHQMQSLPLKDKIRMAQRRIEEWYEHYDGNVYLSFSGGKDSTALLHLVREMYPDVPAVFVNTGLEYPEIVKFVKTFDNVEIIRPKMSFVQVIKKYGYPMFSKEVSECVYGARKYLTSLRESGMLDRPTDRPDTIPLLVRKSYWNGNISEASNKESIICTTTRQTECWERADMESITRNSGGADCKWRKARGIGEYAKRKNGQQDRRSESETCNHAGDVDKRQESSDKGEYP